MEPILSLPPDQFRAALAELQLDPQREAELVRQYRRSNSVMSPLYGLLESISSGDAQEGMQRASLLPVTRPEGVSVVDAIGSGDARLAVPQGLLDILGGGAQAFDAPAAAAQGLIPAEDMVGEALNLAGMAQLGGAAMPAPRGALRSGLAPDDYRGVHRAPSFTKDGTTASIDNLNVIYPDDIYDRRVAAQYYGHMEDPVADRGMIDLFARLRGRPDVGVPVYRAVPVDAPDEINPGDWVTPSRRYAEGHGESALSGEYKIISSNVPARELFTDANSIFEFGWSPNSLAANIDPLTGAAAMGASQQQQDPLANLRAYIAANGGVLGR